jgi:hypothetical protein
MMGLAGVARRAELVSSSLRSKSGPGGRPEQVCTASLAGWSLRAVSDHGGLAATGAPVGISRRRVRLEVESKRRFGVDVCERKSTTGSCPASW